MSKCRTRPKWLPKKWTYRKTVYHFVICIDEEDGTCLIVVKSWGGSVRAGWRYECFRPGACRIMLGITD